jgi:hypothetical protein
MSSLSLTTGLCQGWTSPNTNYVIPTITNLSGTYSPAGGTTLIAIFGTNFKLYSTVKFGTYTPTMIFISSNQIDFYVPASQPSGTNPVQVFNDIYGSNVVEYTLDNSLTFWYLNPPYSNIISNSNIGGLSINGPIVVNNITNSQNIVTVSNLNFQDSLNQRIRWQLSTAYIFASQTAIEIQGDLNVNGNITATGTITPTPSDYRIKDIIEPLNASYTVDNLKPVKYFNKKSKKEEIGFIAHEIQEQFPCLVTGEKDGKDLQTLNYIGLIGVLVQEIQQLKADIAQLKKIKNN